MKRSTEYILTTHTGSLPRPPELLDALQCRDRGEGDGERLDEQVRAAVADVVRRQADAGVSVVNDGEASKIGYATYVKERLDGFGGEAGMAGLLADMAEFPDYMRRVVSGVDFAMPACVGPVSYRGLNAVRADIANLQAALDGADVEDAFLSAASPGVIAVFLQNQHYPSHEEYVFALADAMKVEYDEIHRAGIVLQLDCPDLAMSGHMLSESLDDFRARARVNVEAIAHATRDIPPDAMRMHLCWGNYEGPHHHDVALRVGVQVGDAARVEADLAAMGVDASTGLLQAPSVGFPPAGSEPEAVATGKLGRDLPVAESHGPHLLPQGTLFCLRAASLSRAPSTRARPLRPSRGAWPT